MGRPYSRTTFRVAGIVLLSTAMACSSGSAGVDAGDGTDAADDGSKDAVAPQDGASTADVSTSPGDGSARDADMAKDGSSDGEVDGPVGDAGNDARTDATAHDGGLEDSGSTSDGGTLADGSVASDGGSSTDSGASSEGGSAGTTDAGVGPVTPVFAATEGLTPGPIAIADGTVYFGANRVVPGGATPFLFAVPKTGGSPVPLVEIPSLVTGITVDAADVCFTTAATGALQVARVACVSRTAPHVVRVLASERGDPRLAWIASDGSLLFWSSSGTDNYVRGVPKSGGSGSFAAAPMQTSGGGIREVRMVGTELWFADERLGLFRCVTSDCSATIGVVGSATGATVFDAVLPNYAWIRTDNGDADVHASQVGGGTYPAAAARAGASGVALRGDRVYWIESGSATAADGTLRTCRLPECGSSRTIVTVASGLASPRWLVRSEDGLYVANAGTSPNAGSVMRVPFD
ncbi:MAG: hypothetical protein U0169_00470 [Polyangiaceae bacterium]